MQCPRCHREHPAGVKFCGECGARLESPCPACQAAKPPANKFCHQYSGPLTGGPSTPKFSPHPRFWLEQAEAELKHLEG